MLAWPSVRTMAAAGAVAVAVAGRGDLLFLGALVAVALADRRSSTAALVATAAAAVRWGTTSAATITGTATTLGPGVRVGPPLASAALALAVVALLLAGLGAPRLPRVAAGVTAGMLAGGPVAGLGPVPIVIGVLAATAGAAIAATLPRWFPEPSDRLRTAAPILAAAALALALVW